MRPAKRLFLFGLLVSSVACPKPEGSPRDASTESTVIPVTAPPPLPDAGPVVPPLQEPTRAEVESTLARLEGWVKPGASDAKNAWALAHGLVAFGPTLVASDGRMAVDVMVSDYLERAKTPGPRKYEFPEVREGVPVSPHRDLLVKTLLEVGVPLDRAFDTKSAGKVTLGQLVQEIERTFAFPSDERGWRNYAWTGSVVLHADRQKGKVEAASGPIPLSVVAHRTMSWLEGEQSFLIPLLEHPERLEKKRQGIYAHHCGGLHFVQTAVLAASIVNDPAMVDRARKQLDLVLFRWDAERRLYRQMRAEQPKYRWLLLVQEMKFYGHVLETFALAHDQGVLPDDPELARKLRLVAGDLLDVVLQLEPAYMRQEAVGELVPQTRYDLVGDGCHAIRGLRRALVAFFAT